MDSKDQDNVSLVLPPAAEEVRDEACTVDEMHSSTPPTIVGHGGAKGFVRRPWELEQMQRRQRNREKMVWGPYKRQDGRKYSQDSCQSLKA